jgi:hypothetical protein
MCRVRTGEQTSQCDLRWPHSVETVGIWIAAALLHIALAEGHIEHERPAEIASVVIAPFAGQYAQPLSNTKYCVLCQ